MTDLRDRVPGHALIDELLRQWELGTIHVDAVSNGVVIDEEAESWYRGVLGERRVGATLTQLGAAWTVLHSVPVGAGTSDIDHIVIGPSGIFTINTKFSPGKDIWVAGRGMYVGGAKQSHTVNAIHEARRASIYLSRTAGLTVPVTGLIVFVDPGRMTYKAAVGGEQLDPRVEVLSEDRLLAALGGHTQFSDEQLARIADAAARPETWTDSPLPSSRGSHIVKEFLALEQAVGSRLALPRGTSSPSTGALRRQGGATRKTGSKSRRRKPKKTRVEILVAELALPLVGLLLLWNWYSSMQSR